MWKRKELKSMARKDIFKNYWAAVGICFILAFIGAEYSDSAYLIHKTSDNVDNFKIVEDVTNYRSSVIQNKDVKSTMNSLKEIGYSTFENLTQSTSWIFKICEGGMFIAAALVLLIFIFFVSNPVMVGSRRFFIKNQSLKPKVLEVFSVFHNKQYFNIVYIMFCRFLFTYLWAILLIVPGIIKNYQYRMVPFILADNPKIGCKRVFEISKEMMKNQKWKTFLLDLSFILWRILSIMTFGIIGIFFVNPYTSATFAQLYTKLKWNVIESKFVKEDEIIQTPSREEEGPHDC